MESSASKLLEEVIQVGLAWTEVESMCFDSYAVPLIIMINGFSIL